MSDCAKYVEKYPIGIDLGTTYSCAAVYMGDHIEVIKNNNGNNTTPSIVAFDGDEFHVGESAKASVILNPENTFYDIKRLIGRGFDDKTVQEDIKLHPFNINGSPSNCIEMDVKYGGTTIKLNPEMISALILNKIKHDAEVYLGYEVTEAVITVPAYFTDSQRNSTKIAGEMVGLEVLQIINEPTSAAIAYGFGHKGEASKTVLIFDFGGGTFDVSIVKVKNFEIDVLTTDGNSHLGGSDFDASISTFLMIELQKKHNLDVKHDKKRYAELKVKAEIAKKELSDKNETIVEFYFDKPIAIKITRQKFEMMCMYLMEDAIKTVEKALNDVKLTTKEIDDVVLIGGTSRIPKIQKMLENMFGDTVLRRSVNPDEAVAYGAALKATHIVERTRRSLADFRISDICPMSLGIEVINDGMSVLIPKNSKIPIENEKTYFTTADNQTSVAIIIKEGEDDKASKNNNLGKFILDGIPPLPMGQARIQGKMTIDVNGILNVTATVQANGNTENIIIKRDTSNFVQENVTSMKQKTASLIKQQLERETFKDDQNRLIDKITNILEEINCNEELWTGNANQKHKYIRDSNEIISIIEELEFKNKRNLDTIHDKLMASLLPCISDKFKISFKTY